MQHGVHIRNLALDELELTNALAKLFAVMDIGDDVVHHRLHDAQRTTAQHRTFIVEATHQHFGAVVQTAQDMVLGHFNVMKHQFACVAATHAQLVELLRNAETLHAFFNQESRDATGAKFGFSFGINHQGVGIWTIGDPHLGTIEDVVAAFVLGFELHADDVATSIGFRHRQGAYMFAADEFGQIFLTLRVGAITFDLVHTQIAMRAIAQANACRGAGDFFHCDHMGQVAHVGTTKLFSHGDTQHA